MAQNKSSTTKKNPNFKQQPPKSWDEKLLVQLYTWRIELFGGLLFFFSLVALLNLMGLTHSAFLAFWTGLWYQLASWGVYPLFLSFMLTGVYLAGRKIYPMPQIRGSQIIGFELALLGLLALTYLISGATLKEAYHGESGGLIGWALGHFLYNFFGPVLTGILYIIAFFWGCLLMGQISWDKARRHLLLSSFALKAWAHRISPKDAPRPAEEELPLTTTDDSPSPGIPERFALLPSLDLLEADKPVKERDLQRELNRKKEIIEQTLIDFGLRGTVIETRRGPAVTQFGVEPGYLERKDGNRTKKQKIRVSQIAALQKDLTLALAAPRLRIEAPVPGRGIVGIEVPNENSQTVSLRGILESEAFYNLKKPLGVGLGRDVSGAAIVADLAKMPHLLIAGTTGSGKSVCINALITSLVFNNPPSRLKLVMIDPKKVELIRFNGLPHLLGPVEVDHDRALGVLNWLTRAMDDRYKLLAKMGARNLDIYNQKMVRKQKPELQLPYITVFIDELADLMSMRMADVESQLCRLAQMARATGIHLIVATQRPSTNVITGLIKANFPSRISFAVASNTDSRVILDSSGADQLLGRGDMLFLSADASVPFRVQGCYVNDEEIDRVVAYWRDALPPPEKAPPPPWETLIEKHAFTDDKDELLEKAILVVQKSNRISASMLQRKLRIGYPRAARLMQTLHDMGLVEDPKTGGRTRKTITDHLDDTDPLNDFISQQK